VADRRLAVYLDGRPIGTLTQSNTGRAGFAYHDDYNEPSNVPLSLSLPLGRSNHPPRAVIAFMAGLLPDSEPTLERWGRQFGVSPRNPFALLAHVGQDAAGAVQVLPEDAIPSDAAIRQGDVEWLTLDDVYTIVREMAAHAADWNPGRDTGRWSLAGAQTKVALFRGEDGRWGIPRDSTPTTHILKPSIAGLEHHHVNEHLCLRAAQLAGLPAANTELITDGEIEVLVSERYDRRRLDARWGRTHQEDLCQALAVHPSMTYQSDGGPGIADVAELFRRLSAPDRQASARRFFEALVYNVAIGATDAHAKNYSILLGEGSRAQLGPLYDVATVLPYDRAPDLKSAMKIGDNWEMRRIASKDWGSAASRLGIPAAAALERATALRASIPEAFHRAAQESTIHDSLRGHAAQIADLVSAHIENRRGAFGDVEPTR
jgi:serine/threonine-protein kinase HipA